MSIASCPKCKRENTYNTKFGQCSACGLGYSDGAHVTEPVTVKKVVEVAKEKVTNYVTQSNGGRHCPTCTCGPPKTGAERQKEYRKRKKGKLSE